ncbi:MAG: AAA family ATPase, partial [Erysipelotrichia bacterium]|nr:AAA family ATPase [Erysipelotrichia bacterium]
MLVNLYIRNFILIDELSIDFSDGFNVFTGETGAGKSIFIDGISCLIGSKLTSSMIKNGQDKAIIEGVFTVNKELSDKLAEAGYDSENFIVTREITKEGKSTVRLNQRVTTLTFIKDCLSNYVDIHCQHDNQYL